MLLTLSRILSYRFFFYLLVPITFIVVSVLIMRNAVEKRNRVDNNVKLLRKLGALEDRYTKLAIENYAFSLDISDEEIAEKNEQIISAVEGIRPNLREDQVALQKKMAKIDSLTGALIEVRTRLLTGTVSPENIYKDRVKVKESAIAVLDLLEGGIEDTRIENTGLQRDLNRMWQELFYLLMVACGIAIFLVILLILYRKQLLNRRAFEESLKKSEVRNKALANAIPDMMFRISKDGTYLDFKPSAETFSLAPPSEFIGKKIDDFFPPELAGQAYENIDRALDTGMVQSFEYELDLREKTYEYEARLVKASDDEVIATVRDITERKRFEKALKLSQERYSMAVSAGNLGVWDWDLETDEIYIDPNIKAMLGYKDYEIKNHMDDWIRYVHPDDKEKVGKEVEAHLNGEKPNFSLEHRMLHKDGSIVWFLTHGIAVKDENGKPYRMVGTDTNVTQIKLAEDRLAESEARWRSIIENVEDIIITINKEGKVQSINKLNQGFTKEQIIGKDLFRFLMPTDKKWIKDSVLNVFNTKKPFRYEVNFQGQDGSKLWYSCIASPIIKKDKVVSVIIVCRDDTEKVEAEESLRANERRLNLALETAHMGTWDWDVQSNEVTWSDNVDQIFHVGKGKFKGTYQAYLDLIHPDDVDYVERTIAEALKKGKDYVMEHRIILPDKSVNWLYCKGQVIRDEQERAVRMIGTVMDITQLKQAENAVITAMIEGQDEERKRVSEELHDGLGQILSSLGMNFNAVRSRLKEAENEDESIQNIENLLNRAVKEVRSISHNLMPDILEEFGLVAALEDMVSKFSHTNGFKVDLETVNMKKRLDKPIETALYRITQELTTNVIKHSKAGHVHIQLINHQDSVVLVVEDDGKGFKTSNKHNGIGLKNIESRTKLLNGEMIIDSIKGKGTVVTVEIPLNGKVRKSM